MRRLVIIISILAGCGDLFAGLLLLFAPQAALALMRVPGVRDEVWIQYIGVFVACVGTSYLYGLAASVRNDTLSSLKTIWKLTAMFRIAVGSFVASQIAMGKLDCTWIMVSGTDFFWAFVQIMILQRGIPEHD